MPFLGTDYTDYTDKLQPIGHDVKKSVCPTPKFIFEYYIVNMEKKRFSMFYNIFYKNFHPPFFIFT